jgi:hypothetical protein
MDQDVIFCARMINHGQSEIWLEGNGLELTPRRMLATNEVISVTRRHCAPEVFAAFNATYHSAIGQITVLALPSLAEIAAELRLPM